MKQENIFKKCTNLTRTRDNINGVLMIDTVMEIEIVYIITIYKDYKYKTIINISLANRILIS